MRILLLVDRYLPNPLSSAKMFQDLATEMSSLGNDVTVVTGDDSLRTKIEVSREGDITIVRVRSGAFRHQSRFVRTVNEICLSRLIWNSAHSFFESQSYDLVVCYSPTIFWSGLLKKIKALNDCSIYLVLRDLFPQWALDTGLLSRYGLIYWYFRLHEIRLYNSVDVIGVQSPANLDYFLKPSLLGRYKLEVLYNWTKIIRRADTFIDLRTRLGLEGKVIFMYGGNLGFAQDIDNVLRLASNLKNENDIFFLLVGDGSEFNRIKNLIEKNGFSNIKIFPAVSHSEYQKILAECDVGLITLRGDFKTHNIPGKLLSYLELRKPILASINIGNDLGTIIRDYDAGLVCTNGDDNLFIKHTQNLSHDQDLRLRMGLNGRRLLSEKFSVSSAAQQILSHFSKNDLNFDSKTVAVNLNKIKDSR